MAVRLSKPAGSLVPTLCVGMLLGRFASPAAVEQNTGRKASKIRSHAKRGNESVCAYPRSHALRGNACATLRRRVNKKMNNSEKLNDSTPERRGCIPTQSVETSQTSQHLKGRTCEVNTKQSTYYVTSYSARQHTQKSIHS